MATSTNFGKSELMPGRDRPIRFLLVEDDEDHAFLVRRAMRDSRFGSLIDRVEDGQDALDYLNRAGAHKGAERPDVVILDLKMPGIDGHEVLAAIKADAQLSAIPVVILTTSRADADRARAYASHANSYLVKPLDFDQLTTLVADLDRYWAGWNEPPSV
ncbi:MAG: response regulator [Phycisphaerales bacterium]